MSVKNIIRMIMILAILVGISFIVPRIVNRHDARLPFKGITGQPLTAVTITGSSRQVVLKKKAQEWEVYIDDNIYRADFYSVDSIIRAVEKLEISDIISRNASRHSRFQVDTASGTRVQMYTANSEKPAVDFYLGKMSPDYQKYYFRFENGKDVYYSSGFPRHLVNKELTQWRNRSLGASPAEEIERVVLVTGTTSHVLELTGQAWTYNEREIDKQVCEPLLQRVSSLNASNVIEPGEEEKIKKGLNEHDVLLTIQSAGDVTELSFFTAADTGDTPNAGKYYVVKNNENGIFMIGKSIIDAVQDEFQKIQVTADNLPLTNEQVP